MASPPAWSIGKSQRSTDWRSGNAPGPGAYEPLKKKFNSPSWKMGSSTRTNLRRSDAPGPGAYNSPGKISTATPQYPFGIKTTHGLKEYTPGPGSYEATGLRGYDTKSPSYSIRPKSASIDGRVKVPGPGAYEADSRIQNLASPSFKMGTSKRDDLYKTGAAPGPGAYTTRPSSAFNRESGPKFAFGTSERDPLYGMSKTLPGPGQYDLQSSFTGTQGKGMSLVPRRPDSALSNAMRSPGPGAYNPTLNTKGNAPAYRIGSASRDGASKERIAVPGPGNYEPTQIKGNKGIKIGTSVRSPLSLSGSTPGPGTYEGKSRVGEGPKYVISPRREEVKDLRYAPGPGAYTPSVEYVKDHGPSVKMGTSNRGDLYGSRANPGPGQYDVRGDLNGPRWGFGSEMRGRDMKGAGPGPGSYNIPTKVGDVPKYAYGNAPLKIHL